MADNAYARDDDTGSDVSDLDPESEILAPVQKRIEEQLRKNFESLSLQLHEANNEARLIRTRREDVGVELYNVQQHLAKLQEGLENGHDNLVAIQRLREQKESEKSELNGACAAVQSQVTDLRKKHSQYQTELDKLSETLLKVEQFNEQVQSEIMIVKGTAYKAEEEISKLETAKARQDALVDALNERIKSLSDQQSSLAAQLASQKAETKVARDTLTEALAEMEAIKAEKKQLTQQWKASIVGMQRRDEALRATEEALSEQKEQLLAIDNEIIGFRQGIKAAQQKNAKLSHLLTKAEGEDALLQKQIESQLDRKAKSTEKYNLLKKSLEQTDSQNKELEGTIRVLQSEIDSVVKKTQRAAKEVVDKENKVLETLNKQTTLKKGSQSALQDIERMKNTIREKEMHVTQMENELARIRVDTLQTQAHNDVLDSTVQELEKELASRDTLIEKMQIDIRRKHDEIERKQKALDGLNRQYDAIIASQGNEEGEHMGPLEAMINNLSKSIERKSSENDGLQRDWIKLQTELVNSKNHNSQLRESIQELRAQCTILTQKRNRMLTSTKQQREDIANLTRMTQNMHLEMTKLNTLISTNSNYQEDTANENYLLENDLVKRLQERKREARQLESQVDKVREEKAELLAEMLNAERDVMLWEKKITIAKETEMALDPTIGKDEINRMKKEIYIMEQRLANLQREQRRKVEEMQRLIDHRDVLRTKGTAIQEASKSGHKGATKATVSKENSRLATDLAQKKNEAQTKERQIKECLANAERTAVETEQIQQETRELEAALAQVQEQIDVKRQEFERAQQEKTRKVRTMNRLRDADEGNYKLQSEPEAVQEDREALEAKQRALLVVIQDLSSQFPQLGPSLQDLASSFQ